MGLQLDLSESEAVQRLRLCCQCGRQRRIFAVSANSINLCICFCFTPVSPDIYIQANIQTVVFSFLVPYLQLFIYRSLLLIFYRLLFTFIICYCLILSTQISLLYLQCNIYHVDPPCFFSCPAVYSSVCYLFCFEGCLLGPHVSGHQLSWFILKGFTLFSWSALHSRSNFFKKIQSRPRNTVCTTHVLLDIGLSLKNDQPSSS